MIPDQYPTCHENKMCFGQVGNKHKCSVLIESYDKGKCPFLKPTPTITNGKIYPYNVKAYGRDSR